MWPQVPGRGAQGQGHSSIFISISFWILSFFFEITARLWLLLEKFSAKVVSLAILRSCPRFENTPSADVI